MKLYYDKRLQDPTYYIQEGFRIGKKTTTRNVAKVGKHSELLLLTDDPLQYAKNKVAEMNREHSEGKVRLEVNIDFEKKLSSDGSISSGSLQNNIGYFFLQKIYNELGLTDFFDKITKDTRITYDAATVNRFMTLSRILYPDSKLGIHQNRMRYYEKPDFEYVHELRTLDLLAAHYDEYISHLFKKSEKIVSRDTSVCYYDCTNYYFEIESEDDDLVDEETGEVTKGLRKYGRSKENRPNPIVEMGLFMDGRGIPLSMCIHSGNDNEQTTAIPEEQKLKHMFDGKRFIYCADAGLGSLDIRQYNSFGGNAFIVTQSIKKMTKKLRQAVFSDIDYKLLSDDTPVTLDRMKNFDRTDPANEKLCNDLAYKVIRADKMNDIGLYETKYYKNGKTKQVKSKVLLPQSIIITFSRKVMEYQRKVRQRQIDRANKLLKNLDPETYKKGPHDITRFIKRCSCTPAGEAAEDHYYIDQSVIDEEAQYDGFYAIATNLDDPASDIIALSSKRCQIEDCFRIMKTNFSARPVYHHNSERIKSHFLICFTALLVYRLLEAQLKDAGYHFSIDSIIETMQNMEVTKIEDQYYQSTYTGSQVVDALNEVTGLGLDMKYYKLNALDKKLKKIST